MSWLFMVFLHEPIHGLFQGRLAYSSAVTIVLQTNVGLSQENSSLVAGIIQIVFWVGTLPGIYLLDRLGRRLMLLSGSVVLTITIVLFTAGIAVDTPASSNLALAMLFIYHFSFGMTWNCIPWLYAAEITPLNLRHIGSAICAASEWLWTFVSLLFKGKTD